MFNQQYGDATLRDLSDDAGQALAFGWRQARCWLIEQHQARLGGERARGLQQPPLAKRQVVHIGTRPFTETHEVHQRIGTQGRLAFGPRCRAGTRQNMPQGALQAGVHTDHHVLAHRHAGKRLVVLEGAQNSVRRKVLGWQPQHRLAIKFKRSTGGHQRARNHVERGTFACAVGPDHSQHFASPYLDIQVGHGNQTTKIAAQAPRRQQNRIRFHTGFHRATSQSRMPINPLG